jgi:murein DD-endopeptidase MepM/ murein hydrolase activator NlpD
MTSSFGITPQRQLRDLVAQPAKPTEPARPAETPATPVQLGGQLMYEASYKPGSGAETIQSIQQFLSNEGALGKTTDMLFENYKEQKRQEATRLLQQEATALRDSLENAKETKILSKAGDENLARQNRLSNPWVNFFYYDTKASNAGKQVAVDLASWGTKQSERLAEIDNPAERAAIIAAKVDDLLKPYSDVPSAFRSAKIDPLVSSALLDVKKNVTNKVFERQELKDKQTASEIFTGEIRLGAKFIKGSYGSQAGTVFGEQSLQNAYNKAYNQFVINRGYSEKQFHELIFKEAPNLFIDKNGDGYSDLGKEFTYLNYVKAWKNIKTADGQTLLELRDAKGETFRKALQNGAEQAIKSQEIFEASIERGIQRAQREWTRNFNNESTQFYAQFLDPSDQQITEQRERLKARNQQLNNQNLLPEGMTLTQANELVDKTYPFRTVTLSPSAEAFLKQEVDQLVADGETELPGDLAARVEGTSVMAYAINKFGDARREASNPNTTKARDSLVRELTKGLEANFFAKDEQLKMVAQEGKVGEEKRRITKSATLQASQRLRVESTRYINNKLYEARQRGENINDPGVQLRILEDAKRYFYDQPQYSNVDSYYSLSPTDRGKPNLKGPALGSSKQRPDGSWEISINDTDNRATWASLARNTFKTPAQVREYLKNDFVFKENELRELNYALASGDTSKLSASTRRSLANIQQGFNNKITIAEIVQQQTNRYGLLQQPQYRANAAKIQAAAKAPVAGTGTAPRDLQLYVYNFHHGHSKVNRAVDFQIERGNRAQTANPMPSPLSGRVVYAGFVDGYGNTVVIEADSDGPGYRRNERLLLAHAARLLVRPGQRVSRGQNILVAGDMSPTNSKPGRSTTGTGTPGHLHSQLFKAGTGFPSKIDQHEQARQNDFFKKAVYPLFRKVSDPNRR